MNGFRAGLVALVASGALATAVVAPALPAHAQEANDRRVVATSVDGRPIVARHYGALDAPVQMVILGQMHGTEPGGRRVIRRLAKAEPPVGVGMWLVLSLNPDGAAEGRRQNADGVDLNRNFPVLWMQNGAGTPFWSGPAAASEPETQGMMAFLDEVRPTALISYHQAMNAVDTSHARSRPAARALARWMGMRAVRVPCALPQCHGNLTQWVDRTLKAVAITVELDRQVSAGEARRAAAAVLRLGSWLGR
ncbi:MAG: DUF2817 domain-containing protein [Actinomycetales bacterium]|nr:DUF2817 domain-containing protein [Actinomycetales bacterium]